MTALFDTLMCQRATLQSRVYLQINIKCHIELETCPKNNGRFFQYFIAYVKCPVHKLRILTRCVLFHIMNLHILKIHPRYFPIYYRIFYLSVLY